MRHITLVLFLLIAIVDTHDGSADERALRQSDGKVVVSVDIVVNEPFTDQQAERVRAQAGAAGTDADAAVQQARLKPFTSRCNLWLTYLGRNVKVNRNSLTCTENVRQSGVDGQSREGRMTVEVSVPADHTLIEDDGRRVEFRGKDRYDTWERCHRAAVRARGVISVCDEATQARGDRQFVTSLRVFNLRVKGADADE